MENLKKYKGYALYILLTAVFSTKKQVVKVNEKYAARFKKWYQFSWRYIGINVSWSSKHLHEVFVLCKTFKEAEAKLDSRFPIVTVLNGANI